MDSRWVKTTNGGKARSEVEEPPYSATGPFVQHIFWPSISAHHRVIGPHAALPSSIPGHNPHWNLQRFPKRANILYAKVFTQLHLTNMEQQGNSSTVVWNFQTFRELPRQERFTVALRITGFGFGRQSQLFLH